jgi:hypothetical protein
MQIKNKNLSSWHWFLSVFLPYTVDWIIDEYVPSYKYIKETLHYCFTPVSLLSSAVVFVHNSSKSIKNINDAEEKIEKAIKLFENLIVFLKNNASNKNLEETIKEKVFERSPMGTLLLNIIHKTEKKYQIFDEKTRPKYVTLFNCLTEVLNTVSLESILNYNVLFDVNGITLSGTNILELDGSVPDLLN